MRIDNMQTIRKELPTATNLSPEEVEEIEI